MTFKPTKELAEAILKYGTVPGKKIVVGFGPVVIKAIPAEVEGEGWASPCPQLYIDVQSPASGTVLIGSKNIEIIKELCEFALSKGEGILNEPDSNK